MNAHLTYIMSCGGHQMERPVFYLRCVWCSLTLDAFTGSVRILNQGPGIGRARGPTSPAIALQPLPPRSISWKDRKLVFGYRVILCSIQITTSFLSHSYAPHTYMSTSGALPRFICSFRRLSVVVLPFLEHSPLRCLELTTVVNTCGGSSITYFSGDKRLRNQCAKE